MSALSEQQPAYCVSLQHIADARQRISKFVNATPLLTSSYMTSLSGRHQLFFKCELFQKTGSFKFRGATNAVQSIISSGVPAPCVVTHSSGNHAAALSLAGRDGGLPALIVMPNNAPSSKVAATRHYGGEVSFCEPTSEARAALAAELVEKNKGAVFVHPSEDPRVIAGQGTVGYEIAVELLSKPESFADVVIIPVGGGGLAGGSAVALKGLLGQRGVKVVLAEPAAVDDAYRSFYSRELVTAQREVGATSVADGLKTTLGPNSFPLVRDFADAVITVTEKEILAATKLVWERMKLMIEPSAGVGVAVLLSDEFKRAYPVETYRRVSVVLCGGNVDLMATLKSMEDAGV